MGRTLHYTIQFERPLTEPEVALLERISDNSRKVRPMGYDPKEFDWTCETFAIDPFDHYPWWEELRKHDSAKPAEFFDRRYKELMRSFKNRGTVLKMMADERLLTWVNKGGPAAVHMRGFTKVQGNELNSMWVVYTLLTISRAFPTAMITCRDEGNYLLCPIRLKNGLAQLDTEDFENDMAYRARQIVGAMFREGKLGEHVAKDLPKVIQDDLFSSSYKVDDVLKWMCDEVRHAKVPIERMIAKLAETPSPFGGHVVPPHISNLKTVWIGLENFHRPVIAAHFAKSNKDKFSSIMSGFYGEHWNLEPDKDAKAESAKMLKFVCKLTGAKMSELRVGVSI